jgi:hypothetical protein
MATAKGCRVVADASKSIEGTDALCGTSVSVIGSSGQHAPTAQRTGQKSILSRYSVRACLRLLDMKTEFHTVAELLDSKLEPPIPLAVIPNHMGINLCAVDGISWTKQADGQLVSITIHFMPAAED